LLVGHDEDLQLLVELAVLLLEDRDVLCQGCNLGTELAVSIGDTGIAELNIITFLASDLDLVVTGADLSLKVENDGLEVLGADGLSILLSQENETVLVSSLKVALADGIILLLSGRLVLKAGKVGLSNLEGLGGAAEIEFSGLSNLRELVGAFVEFG
jgi:hypothetical protein